MAKIKDMYLQVLLVAVIIFALGITFILSDLYYKVISLEHEMMHISFAKKEPLWSGKK